MMLNNMYKSKQSESPSLEEGGERLSLLELNALVRRSLEQCLPDEYWIQAELSDVRSNTTGHCYLEFVQKDPRSNNLVAKARGMIWNNIYRLLKPYFEETTGQLFTSGIKVLVKVTVQFHELYGYSLTVLDIDPAYTLGDMARRRREILLQLEEEGVLTLNKELEIPILPQRIAVISSATAAGYGDFCHQLQHNSGGFFFYTELFPALMQGNQVEESVLAALDRINARINEFDVVVIIRGGGATSDLSGFDTYLLAAACAQFPLPIITGIGHERDDTVLDSVAHTRVKTPTAAAELLIHQVAEVAEHLEELSMRIQQGAYMLLDLERRRLETLQTRIPNLVHRKLADARFSLLAAKKDLLQVTKALVARQSHRLELLQQRIADASPDKLLSRGYSITIKDGKAVTVLAALDRINARINEFDVVVIIRGGGATSDLSGFDTYLLAAACAQFPLPIITGIGHERDDTVLDSVAHTRVKTPTAAAELLIHQVAEVAEHLEELSMRIQQGAYMLLDLERRRLETLQTRIPNLVHRKLADARFSLLAAKKDLSQVTKALVARQSHRLELLQQRIADASPDKLLSRGYSITIKDGKAVTDASLLKPGEHLITRLSKGEVRSVVEK